MLTHVDCWKAARSKEQGARSKEQGASSKQQAASSKLSLTDFDGHIGLIDGHVDRKPVRLGRVHLVRDLEQRHLTRRGALPRARVLE